MMPKIEIVNEASERSEHFFEKSKLLCERSEQALRRSYQNLARSANFLLVFSKSGTKAWLDPFLLLDWLSLLILAFALAKSTAAVRSEKGELTNTLESSSDSTFDE